MKPTESASSAQVLKKTQPEEYDLVILGDGTGSTLAAWTFASDGKSVAVVERKFIGGSCPNIACLPSKNIIDSAKRPLAHTTLISDDWRRSIRGIRMEHTRLEGAIVADLAGHGAGACRRRQPRAKPR